MGGALGCHHESKKGNYTERSPDRSNAEVVAMKEDKLDEEVSRTCRFCLSREANDEEKVSAQPEEEEHDGKLTDEDEDSDEDSLKVAKTGGWLSPCNCIGSSKWLHLRCLRKWQRQVGGSRAKTCQVCLHPFSLQPPPSAIPLSHRPLLNPTTNARYDRECLDQLPPSHQNALLSAMREGFFITQRPDKAHASEQLLGLSNEAVQGLPFTRRLSMHLLQGRAQHWLRSCYLIGRRLVGRGSDGSAALFAVNLCRPMRRAQLLQQATGGSGRGSGSNGGNNGGNGGDDSDGEGGAGQQAQGEGSRSPEARPGVAVGDGRRAPPGFMRQRKMRNLFAHMTARRRGGAQVAQEVTSASDTQATASMENRRAAAAPPAAAAVVGGSFDYLLPGEPALGPLLELERRLGDEEEQNRGARAMCPPGRQRLRVVGFHSGPLQRGRRLGLLLCCRSSSSSSSSAPCSPMRALLRKALRPALRRHLTPVPIWTRAAGGSQGARAGRREPGTDAAAADEKREKAEEREEIEEKEESREEDKEEEEGVAALFGHFDHVAKAAMQLLTRGAAAVGKEEGERGGWDFWVLLLQGHALWSETQLLSEACRGAWALTACRTPHLMGAVTRIAAAETPATASPASFAPPPLWSSMWGRHMAAFVPPPKGCCQLEGGRGGGEGEGGGEGPLWLLPDYAMEHSE